MSFLFLLSISLCSLLSSFSFAGDFQVWEGEVNSNGTPSVLIPLELEKQYVIKVSGSVNLGKWRQQGEPLNEDACFEYHPQITPSRLETLRNSMGITICDGRYQNSHVYQSRSFVAKQNAIHFWIDDKDYTDNQGTFKVQVIQITEGG